MPVANEAYWQSKVRKNVARASAVNAELERIGWGVTRVWEHELRSRKGRSSVRGRLRAAILASESEGGNGSQH